MKNAATGVDINPLTLCHADPVLAAPVVVWTALRAGQLPTFCVFLWSPLNVYGHIETCVLSSEKDWISWLQPPAPIS